MKILHLSWDTRIPGVGGSTHEWNISKAFTELGHEVRLVCEWEKGRKIKQIIKGVDVRRVHWRTSIKWFNPLILLIKMVSNSFYQIFDMSPDLIYERYRIFGGMGVVIGKMFGKRTILEVNDPTVDAPFIEGRIGLFTKLFAGLWEWFVFKFSDKIITHHKVMAERADKSKVEVVTNGVDVDKFNPGKFKRSKWMGKFVCLFIGTFAEWQGVSTIIKTAKDLKRYKKIFFVFAGEKRKNDKNTVFLGEVEYNKIPELIANSDVCLYTPDVVNYTPMKKLGFYFSPLKLFEYMSMGKPVIVSDAGNLKELVKDGVNGYKIKVNDSKSLRKKILKLYKNKKVRKKMGEANRKECVDMYSWIEIAGRILK